MRLSSTTVLTSDDWGIVMHYRGWNGKEIVRVIATNEHVESKDHACRLAMNSIRKRGELPPSVMDVVAGRFSDMGIPMCPDRGKRMVAKVNHEWLKFLPVQRSE